MEPYKEFSRRMATEYKLFQTAIFGRYQTILMSGVTPFTINKFVKEAHGLSSNLIGNFAKEIEQYRAELVADTGNTAAAKEMDKKALAEATYVVRSVIAQLTRRLRIVAADTSNMIGSEGVIAELFKKKMTSEDLKTVDRANKKWDSSRMLETAMNEFAYKSFILSEIRRLQQEGFTLAQVKYGDPEKASREIVFSIGDKSGKYQRLEEIWQKVFHPNATATVVGYVQS